MSKKTAASGPSSRKAATSLSVCLVNGPELLRDALQALLGEEDIDVSNTLANSRALAEALADASEPLGDVIVLLLTGGPFSAFHQVREALEGTEQAVPLVVVSEQATRGQVYAALRIGAKAYVSFDTPPEELFRAIKTAAEGKVYLAPAAAEMLVGDVSHAVRPGETTGRLPSVELSQREIEVVQLLCEGLTSKEIGRRLHISAKTVENHRYNIYRKCEVDTLAGLMRHAIQQGLVSI
ncbi:MAG: response regulator transcription factor [Phycisphaerae bacterium]|nr:response regulator transcription factor [Phycisphaerae bacterium]